MFFKKRKEVAEMIQQKKAEREARKNREYDVQCENLAVPEVHVEPGPNDQPEEEVTETVTYDTVAIPEVHIRKRPKSGKPGDATRPKVKE